MPFIGTAFIRAYEESGVLSLERFHVPLDLSAGSGPRSAPMGRCAIAARNNYNTIRTKLSTESFAPPKRPAARPSISEGETCCNTRGHMNMLLYIVDPTKPSPQNTNISA